MTTKTKDFNLATATGPEMKKWGAKNLPDLKLSLAMNDDTMRERIVVECKKLKIEPPTAVIQTKHDKVRKNTKTMTINIAKGDKKLGGLEPVFVGVQGVGYLIPRGIDIKVSPAIVEVLKNAVTDIVTQDKDGEIIHDEVPTYPFSAFQTG